MVIPITRKLLYSKPWYIVVLVMLKLWRLTTVDILPVGGTPTKEKSPEGGNVPTTAEATAEIGAKNYSTINFICSL